MSPARPPSRRTFLRASGVALALPVLESLGAAPAAPPPRRFVAIGLGLGLHAPNLVPAAARRDYEPTPYLEILKDLRDDLTIISGTRSEPASTSQKIWRRP